MTVYISLLLDSASCPTLYFPPINLQFSISYLWLGIGSKPNVGSSYFFLKVGSCNLNNGHKHVRALTWPITMVTHTPTHDGIILLTTLSKEENPPYNDTIIAMRHSQHCPNRKMFTATHKLCYWKCFDWFPTIIISAWCILGSFFWVAWINSIGTSHTGN